MQNKGRIAVHDQQSCPLNTLRRSPYLPVYIRIVSIRFWFFSVRRDTRTVPHIKTKDTKITPAIVPQGI